MSLGALAIGGICGRTAIFTEVSPPSISGVVAKKACVAWIASCSANPAGLHYVAGQSAIVSSHRKVAFHHQENKPHGGKRAYFSLHTVDAFLLRQRGNGESDFIQWITQMDTSKEATAKNKPKCR